MKNNVLGWDVGSVFGKAQSVSSVSFPLLIFNITSTHTTSTQCDILLTRSSRDGSSIA